MGNMLLSKKTRSVHIIYNPGLGRIFQTRHGSEIVCVSLITKVTARGSKKRSMRASLEVLVFFY